MVKKRFVARKYFTNLFLIILFFSLFIGLIGLASADVFFITQPKDSYNFGDNLEVILGSDREVGWTSLNVACGNSSKNVYLQYLNGETEIPLTVPASKDSFDNIGSNCYLALKFNNQTKKSNTFGISNEILFDVKFSQDDFFPYENMTFSGSARKFNKRSVDGFYKLSIEDSDVEKIGEIVNGKISGVMIFPEDIPAGNYNFSFMVYEKGVDGEITNYGNASYSLVILQFPTSINLNLPERVFPGNESEVSVLLLDQSEGEMSGFPVSIKVFDSSGLEILDLLSKTGEIEKFDILKDDVYGEWNVSVLSEGLEKSGSFYVEKNREAEFLIENGSLVIKNVGNVPYDKLVEIKIGNITEVKNLNLSVGSSILFNLEAPTGDYNVSINDGQTFYGGVVSLTGNAVKVSNPSSNNFGFFSRGFLVWFFIFLIFGLFIFVSARKIINKKSVLFMNHVPSSKHFDKQNNENNLYGGVVKLSSDSGKKVSGNTNTPRLEHVSYEAVPTLVLSGEKQDSVVLSLNIKNYEELENIGSNAIENIENSLKSIVEREGRIYKKNGSIVGVFAPVITRTFDNYLTAVEVAREINTKLNLHNERYKHKIQFGLGVNSGDIIASKEQGKLLFTQVDNVVTQAKNLSSVANNNVLIGDTINKKLGSTVKTTPFYYTGYPEIKGYEVLGVSNKRDNKFIQGFLNRNEEYKQDYSKGSGGYKKLDDFRG